MTSMIYPTTNPLAIEQLVLERGEGVYVYDSNGKRYLEGLAGLWCTSLGYGNEEIIQTAEEQMRKFTFCHLFGGKSHPSAMELAEKLATISPVDDARVFLGTSGSDANDTQIKNIRYYFSAIGKPEKRKIFSRDKGYHGVTVASASLTGLSAMHAHFDLPVDALGILRTTCPHYYREGKPGESESEFSSRLADELETLILREDPNTIAAFIAEPVCGAGGVIVPPEGYFEKVQAILNKYDIFLWDDEVICGFGRLGSDFGATKLNMKPDLMSCAKALSSAYVPVSAAMVRGEIYEAMSEQAAEVGVYGHGYTYGGHPLGCAVAIKVLEIYERDNIFDHAQKMGDYFQPKLKEFAEHPLVGEVRGMGLIGALELVFDKNSKSPFSTNSVGAFCQKAAQEEGLIVRGLAGNNIALCPPLIINEEQIDELIEKLSVALDKTLDYAKTEK